MAHYISSSKEKWWVYMYLFKKAGSFVKLLQCGAHVGYFYQTFVSRPVGGRGTVGGRGAVGGRGDVGGRGSSERTLACKHSKIY